MHKGSCLQKRSITNDYGLENEQKVHNIFLVLGKTSLSVILKIFLTFERFEPGYSYKLDSYKKKCVIQIHSFFIIIIIEDVYAHLFLLRDLVRGVALKLSSIFGH